MAKVEVVQSQTDIKNVQFAWWTSFTVSVMYILLCFIIGEEARDSYRWIVGQVTKKREFPRLELPIHHFKKHRPPQPMMSHARPSAKPQVRPLTIELKSGWDDVLDEKKFKWKGSRRNSKSLSPSVCSSPTPSHHSITEEDQQFMASTISYLVSPTAKSLGIEPPLQVPPAAMSPPRRALEIPPRPTSPPPIPKPKSALKAPKNVPVDVDAIGSVLDAPWPVPPESPTPSLSRSYHSNRSPSHSRSHSPASSTEETFGYPLRPTLTPPHLRTRPFEGSSISSFVVETTPSPPSPSFKKVPVKRTSIRSLRRTWSKERIGQAYAASEVIHMTVVQETV
ncbi:hypothetical protein GALMADRAFT_245094 [Galerina marginata CBS 339.88]|uniref:Uncharacterized protein n=1 Tax=Galerina marginata (strain CBS 339.88) TaxID=685588 RepID=A0A067T4N6_GALM3|nr:hypothetical protein GALMADRAFT_245094 [Galerina marginata CBS 339.88]